MRKLAFASLCIVAGCGSPSTGSVDLFIANMASQECDWEFRCCTDAEIGVQDGHKFMTKDQCIPYHQLALENELYVDRLAVTQGKLKLDDAKAQTCLSQMMAAACNPKAGTTNPPPGMTMDACANVFIGVTPVGNPCEFANECVTGAHCVNDALTPGSGVCIPFQESGQICNETSDCDPLAAPALYCAKQDFKCHTRSTAGQPCAYTLDSAGKPTLPLLLECDTSGNLYCDPTSNTCKTLPTSGQPCLTDPPPGVTDSCDPDPTLHLVCQTTTGSTTGTCMGPAQLGQSCTQLSCDTNLYCDPTTQKCAALPTLGQSCANVGQCMTPYFCNFAMNPATCAQPAQLGQSCSNITCDTTLYCDTSTNPTMPTCKALLADGQTCTSSLQCQSHDCSGSFNMMTCAATPAPTVMCSGRN